MSFFKKLNTLVQAHINDIVSPMEDETRETTRRRALSRRQVSQGLQGDVKELRTRMDEALAYEGELKVKSDKLYEDIAEWDSKADAAVSEGRETDARYALGRLHQAQRELEINESALREHRIVTQELMMKLNQLETVLDQAQRDQQDTQTQSPAAGPMPERESKTSIPLSVVEEDDEGNEVIREITQKLDSTRQKLGELIASHRETPLHSEEEVVEEVPQPKHPVSNRQVEDDLAARRARLSGPAPRPRPKDAADEDDE